LFFCNCRFSIENYGLFDLSTIGLFDLSRPFQTLSYSS
jgi:hypothetical protein